MLHGLPDVSALVLGLDVWDTTEAPAIIENRSWPPSATCSATR